MTIDLDIPKLCYVLLPREFRIRFPGVCECVVCTDINRFYNCTNVRGFKKIQNKACFSLDFFLNSIFFFLRKPGFHSLIFGDYSPKCKDILKRKSKYIPVLEHSRSFSPPAA